MAMILVVEDDVTFQSCCRYCGESLGHTVTVVETAEEALEMVDEGDFDLAIVDLLLPGMDGAELIRRMRERPETGDVAIIAFTCMATKIGASLSQSDKVWLPADVIIDKLDGPEGIASAIESLLGDGPPAADLDGVSTG